MRLALPATVTAAALLSACAGPERRPCPAPTVAAAAQDSAANADPAWLTLGCECRRSALALLACPEVELLVGISCIDDPTACDDCAQATADLARAAIATWLEPALRREAGKFGQSLDQRVLADAVKASLYGILGDAVVRQTARQPDGTAASLVTLSYANVGAYFSQMGSEGSSLGLALSRLAEVKLPELGVDAPLLTLPVCPEWLTRGDAKTE